MNDILFLKGTLEKRANTNKGGGVNLPVGGSVNAEHLDDLRKQLVDILHFWENDNLIEGALVSVHYRMIVAKSNRLTRILGENSKSPSVSVRGARFDIVNRPDGKPLRKHVFTHYVSLDVLKHSIAELVAVSRILDEFYDGGMTRDKLDKLIALPVFPHSDVIGKTDFIKIIFDAFHVEFFSIDQVQEDMNKQAIISLYKTDVPSEVLFQKLGIGYVFDRELDETTFKLEPDEIAILMDRAPYLISMNVPDIAKLSYEDVESLESGDDENVSDFPAPSDEPVIGVIDTQFNENVYFHEWVDFHSMIDPDIPVTDEDRKHGTEIDSIIVDGPDLNPSLEDGCGRFRVRHFGVALHGKFSSFAIIRQIRDIVRRNRDIKVWNLSLGSIMEVKESSISPEAAELDRLQNEYDVIFIVAGTNLLKKEKGMVKRLGAPADSLNSIVVNAVGNDRKPADYTRVGPVLSFFNKPDVCYYGGAGTHDFIAVSNGYSLLASHKAGTSYAAPWIARKVAYLIHVMGLSREIAKALIIDSAARWDVSRDYCRMGYGIVPIHINDILRTRDDEIRFLLVGSAESYETYTYNLPVPVENNRHPFWARATMVYFPKCERNQGVDYTSTELDIHFGRIKAGTDGKTTIKSINKNMQGESGVHSIYEADAREDYRKWDNVKHLSDTISSRSRPRTAYDSGLWGMSVMVKERLLNKHKDPLPFGVVVTLREMNGKNRIDEFKKLCMARGWLVNTIDVDNQIDIYQTAEEDIEWT